MRATVNDDVIVDANAIINGGHNYFFLISIYFNFVKNLIFIREMYVFYSVDVINFTITEKFYNLEQLLEIQNPIQYDLLKW